MTSYKKPCSGWRSNGCWETSVAAHALREDRRRSSQRERTVSAANVCGGPSEPGQLLPLRRQRGQGPGHGVEKRDSEDRGEQAELWLPAGAGGTQTAWSPSES